MKKVGIGVLMTAAIALGGNATAIAQINAVSQLRDIAPGDWAFSALRNLVERYDCLDGYPNRTYQGNRALTRYEFAAGLNACMEQMERLITSGGSDSNFDGNELASIQRLLQEFETELSTLGTRVNNLENKLGQVEAHQFSTTTKLEGNVIFAAIGASGNNVDQQVTFGHRTRLNFDASFTGEDNLRVRLQADGLNAPDIGTAQAALAYADTATNNFAVDALVYAFPLGDKTEVAIAANAGASDDFASTINALDGDGNAGALTAFGTRHPIYYQIEDKGIGINHKFSDRVALGLGYMAAEADNPDSGSGLFNGSFGSMAQLTLTPTDNLELGFTYLRSYRQSDTGTGSNLSNFGAFTADPNNFASTTGSVPISSDSYGIQASWQLHDNFILGGWGGLTQGKVRSNNGLGISTGDFDVWNWAITLGFPDLGKEGSLGGIIVGMEPKMTSSTITNLSGATIGTTPNGATFKDSDTSLHVEAFYQFPINDHVSITPGIVWLTNPDHNRGNDDIVIGTVRTLFNF